MSVFLKIQCIYNDGGFEWRYRHFYESGKCVWIYVGLGNDSLAAGNDTDSDATPTTPPPGGQGIVVGIFTVKILCLIGEFWEAQLLLKKEIVLHCLKQPSSMLSMTILVVEIFADRLLRVFLMYLSATAEKQRVTCACLSRLAQTDRAMHKTPQNRRCRPTTPA